MRLPGSLRAAAGHAGLALTFAGCLACCLLVGRSGGVLTARWHLYALIVLWCLLAPAATAAALWVRPRARWVLAGAVVLQAAALTAGPQLSDDLYRYVWDARVTAAGIDPYRYPPDAPALAGLRDPFLWPSPEGCLVQRAELPRSARADPFAGVTGRPGCTAINRPSVRTLYPPAAQLAFRIAAAVPTPEPSELQVQVPAALASVTLTGLLLLALRRAGRPRAWALLYAASPLAALEAGMEGHVDVVAAALAVGLLMVLAVPRARAALVAAAGALLALATLVKLYPAALATVVVARWGWRSARTAGCAAAAVLVGALLYLPYVLDIGTRVLGYLPGYLRENHYDSAKRYLLLGAFVTDEHAPVLAALALLALVLWSSLRRVPADLAALAGRATAVVGGALLVLTPGNAWYCSLLVCTAALAGRPEWLGVVVANYTVYVWAVLGREDRLPLLSYALAAALVVVATLARRVRAARSPISTSASS